MERNIRFCILVLVGLLFAFGMSIFNERDSAFAFGGRLVTTVPMPTPNPSPKPTPKPSSQPSGQYGNTGSMAWKPGSIYGPKLSQKELNEVKSAINKAIALVIKPDMTEYEKLEALAQYLMDVCEYGDWSVNKGNTAWGALIKGQAACSGYARAYKALCDTAGLECYYVHASSDAYNPEHQWNIVRCDGAYYIADVQLYDTSSLPLSFYSGWVMGSNNKKGSIYRYKVNGIPAVSEENYVKPQNNQLEPMRK